MVEMNEEDIKEAITLYLNNRVGQVFARTKREGWDVLGNEVSSDIII
jgi:N6-adenosine-specific RNA methylase IME4